jgi:hypothetical protein
LPIIIPKNGKDAKRIEKISFKKEEDLLKYISDNPDCIPIEDIKEDVQFEICVTFKYKKLRFCIC